MAESQARWSDLPPQLWPVIGERLDTYIDVLRFRSVCRLWRDSLPKLNAILPLPIPSRPNHELLCLMSEIVLFRKVIYRFSPVDHHHQSSNSVSCSSSRAAADGWLGTMESTELDKRFQRPIYSTYKSDSKNKRKVVNFLDFEIEEVAKSYTVGLTNNYNTSISAGNKVVLLPDSDVKNCTIVGIQTLGCLAFRKLEATDNYWNHIDETNSLYDDMIVYKGKIHAVNREGKVSLIDSSMKLVQISPPMSVSGDLKHFVECKGELYMVDRFVERNACPLKLLNSDSLHIRIWCRAKTVDFKVYRLDEEMKMVRWVEVKNFGNEAFVLSADSGFSVSASDFEGFKGSCIYFSHELLSNLGHGFNTHVFDLQKTSILKSSLHILQGPPIWLDWETSSRPAYDLTHLRELKLC